MKKKYSISFFAVSMMFALMLSFAYRLDYESMHAKAKEEAKKTGTEESQMMATEGNASKGNIYYLKELNGFVTVYLSDKKTVYEYTSIHVDSLPQDVALQIAGGIPMESEEKLYSFLEGYSS